MCKVLDELIKSNDGFKIIPIIIFSDKFNLEKILKNYQIAKGIFEKTFIQFCPNLLNTYMKKA